MAVIYIGRTLSSATDSVTAVQGTPGGEPWLVADQAQLIPDEYDAVVLTYTALNQIATAAYKTGGTGGTTVALLTLVYDGQGRLTSVART